MRKSRYGNVGPWVWQDSLNGVCFLYEVSGKPVEMQGCVWVGWALHCYALGINEIVGPM